MSRGVHHLRVANLSLRRHARLTLCNVSFEASSGEVIVLLGENGAGKSTLLDTVGGVLTPTEGHVYLDEQSLRTLPGRQRALRIASCGQHNEEPESTPVRARIAQGLIPRRGVFSLVDEATRRLIDSVADELGIGAVLDRTLGELSGGERRRVQLARSLIDRDAGLLLLDEPHAGIDVRFQSYINEAIRRRAADGCIVLTSVHDISLVNEVAQRVIALRQGKLVLDDTPNEALSPRGLKAIYDVDAEVVTTASGRKAVVINHAPPLH